ncbi:MAG: leucine-rich repeat domain-containing protein [Promethearchaeota archaeon]
MRITDLFDERLYNEEQVPEKIVLRIDEQDVTNIERKFGGLPEVPIRKFDGGTKDVLVSIEIKFRGEYNGQAGEIAGRIIRAFKENLSELRLLNELNEPFSVIDLASIKESLKGITRLKELWLKGFSLMDMDLKGIKFLSNSGSRARVEDCDFEELDLSTILAEEIVVNTDERYMSEDEISIVSEGESNNMITRSLRFYEKMGPDEYDGAPKLNIFEMDLSGMECLESLKIDGYNIEQSDLESLFNLPEQVVSGLKVLEIDNASLEEVPEELGNLVGLMELSLSGNKLKNLPESIFSLKNLEVITLMGNYFSVPYISELKERFSDKELRI